MKNLFDWFRKRYLCIKYGTKNCADCKFCANDFDFSGCSMFLKNFRNRFFK